MINDWINKTIVAAIIWKVSEIANAWSAPLIGPCNAVYRLTIPKFSNLASNKLIAINTTTVNKVNRDNLTDFKYLPF